MGERLKKCLYCQKVFRPDHGTIAYCSDDCRKLMKKQRHAEFTEAMYGDAKFIPLIDFTSWEDRFDEADKLTQYAMLQSTLSVSFATLQTASPEKWSSLVEKAKEIHRAEGLKMLEGIAKTNEIIARKNEEYENYGWKRKKKDSPYRQG